MRIWSEIHLWKNCASYTSLFFSFLVTYSSISLPSPIVFSYIVILEKFTKETLDRQDQFINTEAQYIHISPLKSALHPAPIIKYGMMILWTFLNFSFEIISSWKTFSWQFIFLHPSRLDR